MIHYLLRQFEDKAEAIERAPISSEEKTRLKHYSVFVLSGIPTMVGFGLFNILKSNYLLTAFIALSAAGLTAGWFWLMNTKKGTIVYRINAVLFGTLILYMLLIGGESGSKALWAYTYPLISFFLFGKKEGLIWNIVVLVSSILLFWNPFDASLAYDYPVEFIIRFLSAYLIVSGVTYWFEYFRYRYHIDIEEKNQSLYKEIMERRLAEKERELLIEQLKSALAKVKKLSGFLPICASCKKIRDDKGYWNQIECYIRDHSEADFSHGICPDCHKSLYPEFWSDHDENL